MYALTVAFLFLHLFWLTSRVFDLFFAKFFLFCFVDEGARCLLLQKIPTAFYGCSVLAYLIGLYTLF